MNERKREKHITKMLLIKTPNRLTKARRIALVLWASWKV